MVARLTPSVAAIVLADPSVACISLRQSSFRVVDRLRDTPPDLFAPNEATWAFEMLDAVGCEGNLLVEALERLGWEGGC